MKDIKIGHFNNLANNAYNIVRLLRKKGYNAEVVMDKNDFIFGHPQWEDGDFEISGIRTTDWGITVNDAIRIIGTEKWGESPNWVKYFDHNGFFGKLKSQFIRDDIRMPKFAHPYYLIRNFSKALDRIKPMTKYDLLHTWGVETALAPFSGKPYVAQPYGSDIMDVPFRNNYMGKLQRKGYQKAKSILFGDPQFLKAAEKLKLKNMYFFPFPVDMERYAPSSTPLVEYLKNKYNFNLLIMWPTRQDWSWKGCDRFIKGFAKFVKEYKDVHLLMTEWGRDFEKSRLLIKKLNIKEYVSFIPALAKRRLVQYFNASGLIVDQFVYGSYGTSMLEAMACAKPVMMHLWTEGYEKFLKELPPILEAYNEHEIYEKLIEAYDKKTRESIGERSREWVSKYHNGEKLVDKLIEFDEKALEK